MTTYRAGRRVAPAALAGLLLLALLVGGGIGFILDRSGRPATSPAPTTSPAAGATTSSAAAVPLDVTGITPAAGAVGVAATSPITVNLSGPLAASSPLPALSPAVAGSWQRSGSTLTFTPTVPFAPLSRVTVHVPSGPAGLVSASGGQLPADVSEQFRIANGSVLRLQQLLSLLAYSPLSWTPTASPPAPGDGAAQLAAIYTPPPGSFSWTHAGWPRRLRALWRPGAANVFTRGLVMSFQADHGLDPNGRVNAAVWNALLAALAANDLNTGGYNFALADKAAPQSFAVWHDGAVVLRSQANTGIAGSPTPDGTFPVNTRLRRQVMRGTNPDGSKYADLVQYIAYFHGSDAVHYMDRADYGIPQSLGCIELPLASAAHAWPYLAYGTLVAVIH